MCSYSGYLDWCDPLLIRFVRHGSSLVPTRVLEDSRWARVLVGLPDGVMIAATCRNVCFTCSGPAGNLIALHPVEIATGISSYSLEGK